MLLQCVLLQCVLLQCVLLQCVLLQCVLLQCVLLQCVLLQCVLLQCVLLQCVLLQCVLLQCVLLQCVLLQCVLLQSQERSPRFVKNLNIVSVALVHNYLYNLTSLIAVVCTVTCEAVMVDPKAITVFRNVMRCSLVHMCRLFKGGTPLNSRPSSLLG